MWGYIRWVVIDMNGLVIRTCAAAEAAESAVSVPTGGRGNSDKPEVGNRCTGIRTCIPPHLVATVVEQQDNSKSKTVKATWAGNWNGSDFSKIQIFKLMNLNNNIYINKSRYLGEHKK